MQGFQRVVFATAKTLRKYLVPTSGHTDTETLINPCY